MTCPTCKRMAKSMLWLMAGDLEYPSTGPVYGQAPSAHCFAWEYIRSALTELEIHDLVSDIQHQAKLNNPKKGG